MNLEEFKEGCKIEDDYNELQDQFGIIERLYYDDVFETKQDAYRFFNRSYGEGSNWWKQESIREKNFLNRFISDFDGYRSGAKSVEPNISLFKNLAEKAIFHSRETGKIVYKTYFGNEIEVREAEDRTCVLFFGNNNSVTVDYSDGEFYFIYDRRFNFAGSQKKIVMI